jgi:hypothetical protein
MKGGIVINGLVAIYQLSVIVLVLTGQLSFGHGLGDAFYWMKTAGSLLLQLVILVLCSRIKSAPARKNYLLISGAIF